MRRPDCGVAARPQPPLRHPAYDAGVEGLVGEPTAWGLPPSTPRSELFRVALDNYVRLNVLPPGWISTGVVGALLMPFAYTRLKTVGKERIFWIVVSLAGLAEPVWHFMVPRVGPLTGYELDSHAAVGAAIQVAVAIAVWGYGTRRRTSTLT